MDNLMLSVYATTNNYYVHNSSQAKCMCSCWMVIKWSIALHFAGLKSSGAPSSQDINIMLPCSMFFLRKERWTQEDVVDNYNYKLDFIRNTCITDVIDVHKGPQDTSLGNSWRCWILWGGSWEVMAIWLMCAWYWQNWSQYCIHLGKWSSWIHQFHMCIYVQLWMFGLWEN